jgi:hypothetical protein
VDPLGRHRLERRGARSFDCSAERQLLHEDEALRHPDEQIFLNLAYLPYRDGTLELSPLINAIATTS